MRRLSLLAASVVLGCGEPVAPTRPNTYAFDNAGDVFRWPGDRLPVRYFADTRGHMRALVNRGLGTWEGQFLYGEFRAVLVSDSNDADVIVLWADSIPPDVPPDQGPPVFACDGVTTFSFDTSGVALDQPVRAEVSINLGQTFTAAQVAACVQRVSLHELGHTLGILSHSSSTGDLMHPSVPVPAPSDRDRQTVEVLYHTVPNITPPPR